MQELFEKFKKLDKEKRDELLKKINQCSEQSEIAKIFKESEIEISDSEVATIWDYIKNKSLNNDELASVVGGCDPLDCHPFYFDGSD